MSKVATRPARYDPGVEVQSGGRNDDNSPTKRGVNGMTAFCVVVAEGARARLFTLEHNELPEFEGGPDLVEHDSLLNPEHRVHGEEIYADSSGRNRTPGGQGYAYDEHREQHDANVEKRFAAEVSERRHGE